MNEEDFIARITGNEEICDSDDGEDIVQAFEKVNDREAFNAINTKISTKCELTRKNYVSCSMSTPQCENLLLVLFSNYLSSILNIKIKF